MKSFSSGNRLQDICNRLQRVSLYKFKMSEMQPFAISSPWQTLFSQISKSHNFLISQPNHVPQSPKFIIFHSPSSPPIKTSKKSFKWQNHKRSKRAFRLHPQSSELEVMDHPRHRQPKFLPPYHLLRCFPRKNNVSGTIPFSLLVPLSTLSL